MPYDDSIRLLRISKGVLSGPVEATLEFARLDGTTPAYEALSYLRGSSAQVSQIIHRPTQTAISITKNLYNARKGAHEADQDRVIWVDALCINLEDGKEKGVQVRKMNLIYARASHVIVWLGADSAGDADGAFGALCALANTKGTSAHYTSRLPHHAPLVPDSFVPTSKNYHLCKKATSFFCQPWYTRLWVLQEIVLA
ncbi:hypothetical protein E8E11_001156 [Didymella keratinophila]|nr:hypothetical protein E8E11_001156 [Didymella keratinophila]